MIKPRSYSCGIQSQNTCPRCNGRKVSVCRSSMGAAVGDHAIKGQAMPRSRNRRCPLLALSGHRRRLGKCPLLGVKRTSATHTLMSASDPKRTSKAKQGIAPDSNLETGIASWGRPAHCSRAVDPARARYQLPIGPRARTIERKKKAVRGTNSPSLRRKRPNGLRRHWIISATVTSRLSLFSSISNPSAANDTPFQFICSQIATIPDPGLHVDRKRERSVSILRNPRFV